MEDLLRYQFIEKLKNLPFVEEIWLFGSRSRGDHRKTSDIDLALICPHSTEKDWINVMDIIEEADTLLEIDCIHFDEKKISPELFHNILNSKKVVYVKKSS